MFIHIVVSIIFHLLYSSDFLQHMFLEQETYTLPWALSHQWVKLSTVWPSHFRWSREYFLHVAYRIFSKALHHSGMATYCLHLTPCSFRLFKVKITVKTVVEIKKKVISSQIKTLKTALRGGRDTWVSVFGAKAIVWDVLSWYTITWDQSFRGNMSSIIFYLEHKYEENMYPIF